MRPSIVSRVAGAAAGVWLCGAGAAWAGDGVDLGSLQALLNDPTSGLCSLFKMSSCPVPPTVTQAVLEVAGLGNNLPEMVRVQNNILPRDSVTAGNPAIATVPSAVSDLMSSLTPLAFISSQISATATATQLYDPEADTFLYAVGVSSIGFSGSNGLAVPDTAYFIYDDLSRNNVNFATGAVVAKFLLPLTVLNSDGTERAVPATLNFVANNAGDCSTSFVVGNFPSGTSLAATQAGIGCQVFFGTSPTSAQKHTIFLVAVPLLVTGATASPNTDPAYFYSQLHAGQTNPVNTGVFTAFEFNDLGHALSNGASIGLAPTAAPLCTTLYPGYPSNPSRCPPVNNAVPPPFALCASLPVNNESKLHPAVGAYYAIATSGEMFLSAPLPSVSTSVCPAL